MDMREVDKEIIRSGYKTIRETCIPRGGQHVPSKAKSWQPFILTKTIPNVFLLGVGALKTYNLARYGIIVFNLLLHCQMSQTSSPPSLPFR